MTPLTKEQVEKLRPAESVPNSAAEMRYADDIRGLCDLALQSLSLESVRSEALGEIIEEVSRAITKFPTWPTDPLHALAVLGEEFGELTKAMLQVTYEPYKASRKEVHKEAVQTAAMALRLCASLDTYEYEPGLQHEQTALQSPARVAEGGLEEATRIAKLRVPNELFGPWDDEPPYSGPGLSATPVPSPESPAKEQPGEQNADVAAMVKRLRELSASQRKHADGWDRRMAHTEAINARILAADIDAAAAMIEKLWQGWIPVAWRLVNKNGQHIQSAKTYSFDPSEGGNDMERIAADQIHLDGFPHNWQPLYARPLPPPPERP